MEQKAEYISFETAKMLKILGFRWKTFNFYTEEGKFKETVSQDDNNKYDKRVYPHYKNTYSAPTQAVAMRWLREVENYHIYVMLCDEDIPSYQVAWDHFFGTMITTTNIAGTFPTYEEAMEAGIKEVLNKLIKENNDA